MNTILKTQRITQVANAGIGQWQKLDGNDVVSVDDVYAIYDGGRYTRLPIMHYAIDINAKGEGLVRIIDPCWFEAFEVTYAVMRETK